MREWRYPFDYEYEELFPGIRRLFKTGNVLVFVAEKDGKPCLVIDESARTNFEDPDYVYEMDGSVAVIEFRHVGERLQYLNDEYAAWREWLESDWVGPGLGMRWESWSLNGEVCFDSRIPASTGGDEVAQHLWWTLREYASLCRRFHNATGGALRFEVEGRRTRSAFAKSLDQWYDLALFDPLTIQERIRGLGGDPGACKWPGCWGERDGVTLLLEERQVVIPARLGKIAGRVRKQWEAILDVVEGVDEGALESVIGGDTRAFLGGVVVALHKRSPGVTGRPSLEANLQRHEQLVASLEAAASTRSHPVTWHALWRLPPGMADAEGVMLYPAVSFAASIVAAGRRR